MTVFMFVFRMTFFFLISVLIILSGCSKTNESGLDIGSKKVFVKVDGEPIYNGDIFRRIQAAYGRVDKTKIDPNQWQQMLEGATQAEILDRLLLKKAVSEDMKVSSEEVDHAFTRTKEMLGEKQFKEMLKKRDVTGKQFRDFLRERKIINKYKELLFSTIAISDDKLKQYYRGHKEKFNVPESVRLEVVTLNDKKKADEVFKRWKKGEDFEALNNEYSKVVKNNIGRKTKLMPYHVMPMVVQLPVREGKIGEILEPIKAEDKVYVIKILDKRDKKTMDFNEAKEQIRAQLKRNREQKILDEWYASAVHDVKIEYVRD